MALVFKLINTGEIVPVTEDSEADWAKVAELIMNYYNGDFSKEVASIQVEEV